MAYSQQDPNWKNIPLGFDSGDPKSPSYGTIGKYGCYVTAIANVCKWAGNDLNPAQVNDICKQRGWFVRGDEIARDDVPAQLCTNLSFVGRTNWTDTVSMDFFADASSPDVAYILKIDAYRNIPGLQSHFVMVWKTYGNGDLEIDDSWDGARKALSHYGNPSVVIYSAIKFVKTHPTPPPPPPVAVDVTPPVPVVVPAPTPIPSPVNITPPVMAPSMQTYSLVKQLPYYNGNVAASARKGPKGTLNPGAYYIFNSLNGMLSLTKTPGQSQGTWINPADNVLTPRPEPKRAETTADIQMSWHWFFENHQPIRYQVLQDYDVLDIVHGGKKIEIHAGRTIDIYGTFVKDDITYLRPFLQSDLERGYYFYGIPTDDIHTGAPILDNPYTISEKVQYAWERLYDVFIRPFKVKR